MWMNEGDVSGMAFLEHSKGNGVCWLQLTPEVRQVGKSGLVPHHGPVSIPSREAQVTLASAREAHAVATCSLWLSTLSLEDLRESAPKGSLNHMMIFPSYGNGD